MWVFQEKCLLYIHLLGYFTDTLQPPTSGLQEQQFDKSRTNVKAVSISPLLSGIWMMYRCICMTKIWHPMNLTQAFPTALYSTNHHSESSICQQPKKTGKKRAESRATFPRQLRHSRDQAHCRVYNQSNRHVAMLTADLHSFRESQGACDQRQPL